MKQLVVLALGLLLCTAPLTAQGGGGSGEVGSLPKRAAKDNTCKGTVHVGPGGSAFNGDGVLVTTDAGSNGSMSLTPMNGTSICKSKANGKAGWKGHVSGLDDNDSASLATGGNGYVSSTGGTTVTLDAGVHCVVTHTGPVGSAAISVTTPTGTSSVLPGQQVTFNT